VAVKDFFDTQSAASAIKTRITATYFDTWASIVLPTAIRMGNKIAYRDLYCGPGRYGDNQKSTPLLILEKAIQKPELAKHLVTIFNDGKPKFTAALRKEIDALPGIEKLAHAPHVVTNKVGEDIEEYYLTTSTIPSFTFLDPFGYIGLTQNLIKGVTKDFACDCLFFFNYRRINSALGTPIFRERMGQIFGNDRALKLEKKLQAIGSGNAVHKREELIFADLVDALKEVQDVYVRRFRFMSGKRVSHMLVFVTKHPLGDLIMNDIMAKEGYRDDMDISSYTYSANPPPANKLWFTEFEALKNLLCDEYEGQTLSMGDIHKDHCPGKDYYGANYKDALNDLEAEGRITSSKPLAKRPIRNGKRTFGPDILVTFPRK
jgi:three-Cys-motif partner protein